jgi:SAM-dependent methyltransferase
MPKSDSKYIPALRFNWLTSLYDPLVRLAARESTFKRRLVEQAGISTGHRVLDVGCGTATLTLLIKQENPGAEVLGLDGDPKVLEVARRKVARSRGDIRLDHGMSHALPYTDCSFDRVLSSLLFHHLTRQDKERTLAEVLRVLHPNGEFHLADWGKATNIVMRAAFLLVQLLDGFGTTADNVKGLLPALLADAGFEEIREWAQYKTVFGTLSLYTARKPVSSDWMTPG